MIKFKESNKISSFFLNLCFRSLGLFWFFSEISTISKCVSKKTRIMLWFFARKFVRVPLSSKEKSRKICSSIFWEIYEKWSMKDQENILFLKYRNILKCLCEAKWKWSDKSSVQVQVFYKFQEKKKWRKYYPISYFSSV